VALIELLVGFLGASRRLAALQVVLLAVHEHDDIGVLLDRARLAKVGKLRPLVLALLDGTAQLRQRQHRHIEFLGQRLQAARDLGNLLHAILLTRPAGGIEELQIVDHQQAEPMGALQAARPGPERGDGKRRCVIDEEIEMLEFLADRQHLVEIAADQLALADLFGRHLGLFGQHSGGQLLRRHFEREEADHGAIDGLGLAVLAVLLAIGSGGVERDVGCQRGLSHRRTAGENDEIRPMEAAQELVELEQARGHAGELTDPVVGRLGRDGCFGEGGAERLEAALGLAGRGQLEELLLCHLDLVQRRLVDVAAERAVDDFLAEIDELPAQVKIVHGPSKGGGIDHMHRSRGEAGEVGRGTAGRLHRLVLLDVGLQGDGAHHLTALDQPRQRIEELSVQRIGEVFGTQELGHALIGSVVDEDGAQKCLFGLEIVWRLSQACIFCTWEARDVGRIF